MSPTGCSARVHRTLNNLLKSRFGFLDDFFYFLEKFLDISAYFISQIWSTEFLQTSSRDGISVCISQTKGAKDEVKRLEVEPRRHSGPGCGRINLSKCTKNQAKWGNSTLNIAFPKTRMIFNESPPKKYFWPFLHVWPCQGSLWAIGAKKRPAKRPNGHLPENRRYPKLPQAMEEIWSHRVGSVWAQ